MIRPVRQDGTIETGGPFVPIRRARVVERIAAVALQRITLIIAPAGYGKSVALRHFLETLERTWVRYDVRAEHNELLGFLRGLCDALGDHAPYARAALAAAYDRNAGSSSPGLDLAQWMHTHLEAFSGTIAIDDLHVAQADREVTRFVTSLIERTKGRVEWIIASRTSQGLPIGTWLAYGESDLSIDEHDLRFTVDEAKDAARSCRLGVREEELYDLLQLTDGWATAVSFALRTSTRSTDLRQKASTTREMIYSYLAEQVYAGLTEEQRTFLESSALLSEIEPQVMIAAGFDRTVALLEAITNRVAFLHADEDGIYRCHDLFREFLIRQLELRGESAITTSREQLAATLDALGRTSAALRLYIDAANIAEVQRMLESGFDLLEAGQGDVVLSALALLERNSKSLTPIAMALRGTAQIASGHYEEGERRLAQAQASIDDVVVFGRVGLQLALSAINRQKDPTAILGALFSRPDLPELSYLEARAMLAVYHSRSKAGDTLDIISEVETGLRSIHDDTVRAKVLQRLGLANMQLGRSTFARKLLEESAALAEARQLWSLNSRALNNLSIVVMNTDYDVAAALRFAQGAASSARKAGDFFDLQTSLLMMLSIEVRRGNTDRVLDVEREIAQLRASDRVGAMFLASSQAHRAAWEGRFAEAHRLFAGIIQRQPHDWDKALTCGVFSLCLALDDRTQEASIASEAAIAAIDHAHVESDGMNAVSFEIAKLLAILSESVSGRHTQAGKLLRRKALSSHEVAFAFRRCTEEIALLAKNPQYIVGDIGQYLDTLRSDGFGGYSRYLEMALMGIHERIQGEETTTVKLTGAELRILRDLASGLTPKAIAAEMNRSVLTVETHIKHLIVKLGCRGRAEAISAGRRMGLIPEARG